MSFRIMLSHLAQCSKRLPQYRYRPFYRSMTSWIPNPCLETEPLAQTVWRVSSELDQSSFLTSHHQQETLSFTDVFERSSALSSIMEDEMDLVEGDVLVMWLPNCVENILTQLAAAQIGVAIATVKDECGLRKCFDTWGSRCKGVVVSIEDSHVAKDIAVSAGAQAPTVVVHGAWGVKGKAHALGDLPREQQPEVEVDNNVAQGAEQVWDFHDCQNSGVWMMGGRGSRQSTMAFYNFSHGFSQEALQHMGQKAANSLDLTPDDVICLSVPLNHSFGMGFGFISALTTGASIVLPSPIPDAKLTLAALEASMTSAQLNSTCEENTIKNNISHKKNMSRNILFADSHLLKELESIINETSGVNSDSGGKKNDDSNPNPNGLLQGAIVKVGSGDNISTTTNTFLGTNLIHVGIEMK